MFDVATTYYGLIGLSLPACRVC